MKSASLVRVAVCLLITACGKGSVDGAALAREVCACTERTNALKADAPNRDAEQQKCLDMQRETWDTVKGTDQQDAYNAVFPCGM